jgi:hypothetical protein
LEKLPGGHGQKLANGLSEAQRSRLKVEVADVLERAVKGQEIPEFYYQLLATAWGETGA